MNALDAIVFGEQRTRAVDDARTFFTEMRGRWFDLLIANGPDTVDIVDLVAVSSMSSRAPWISVAERAKLGDVIRPIQHGPLHQVPESAWFPVARALRAIQTAGLDENAASLLLTRKRPNLVPVYVPGSLSPHAYWRFWWEWFSYKTNQRAAYGFYHEVGLGNKIGVLRVLDAALWMADWRSQQTSIEGAHHK